MKATAFPELVPESANLLDDDDDDDVDDNSYVPESLKGFLAEADEQISKDIADVLNHDYSKPKAVPSVDANFPDDEDEKQQADTEDPAFFQQILQQEDDETLKQALMQGLTDDGPAANQASLSQQQQQHEALMMEEESFLSPMQPPSVNPAAFLTLNTAKNMAMDGVTPRNATANEADLAVMKNLQQQMDRAATDAELTAKARTPRSAAKKLREKMQKRASPNKSTAIPTHIAQPADDTSEAVTSMLTSSSQSTPPPKRVGSDKVRRHPQPKESPSPMYYAQSQAQTPLEAVGEHSNMLSPSDESTQDESIQLQPATNVTKKPIGNKGLKANEKTTNKITEVHPKVLPPSESLESPPHRARPSPQKTPLSSGRRRPLQNRQLGQTATTTPQHPTKSSSSSHAVSPDRPQEVSVPHRSSPDGSPTFSVESYQSQISSLGQPHRKPSRPKREITVAKAVSPRLLQRTASNRAKHEENHYATTMINTSTDEDHWKGRKELTSPDKISSRLLQGTSSSRARKSIDVVPHEIQAKRTTKTSSRPLSNRLLQPTQASKASSPRKRGRTDPTAQSTARRRTASKPISTRLLKTTQAMEVQKAKSPEMRYGSRDQKDKYEKDRQAARDRVRQRIEQQKRREDERKSAMQERIRQRQQEQKDKKEKMKAALARARTKRERLETMERERVANLKKRIQEKDAKTQQRLTGRNRSTTTRPTQRQLFTPTIPVAPKFRTDSRLHTHEDTTAKEPIPLAHTEDIYKNGLREKRAPTPENFLLRRLTIPQGPRLSTSKRLGDKGGSVCSGSGTPVHDRHRNTWETELRSVSSPLASDRSASSRLTIPHTPQFHEIRPRPLPKSTAEKEKEEMEYFNSHPFKARPVRMNDTSSVSSKPALPPRPVTTPSPFHFQTDDRLGAAPNRREEDTRVDLFHAKASSTPSTSGPRRLTTPEPFHFQTSRRVHKASPQTASKTEESKFKARPMPDFSRHTGLTMQRRTEKNVEAEVPKPFKARPMPNFHKSGPPKTIRLMTSDPPASQRPGFDRVTRKEHEAATAKFRARKLPKRKEPSIPVRQRDPARLRSPEEVVKPPEPVPEVPSPPKFKALASPTKILEAPTIPVRDKDPSKLRKLPEKEEEFTGPIPFHARPAPKMSPPLIPVRARDPSRLRSPTNGGTKEVTTERRVLGTHRKRDPTPMRTVESPEDPAVAKARMRDRMILMGRRSGASKFSSSSIKARLDQVAPVASPEPNLGFFCGMQSNFRGVDENNPAGLFESQPSFERSNTTHKAEEAARRAIAEGEKKRREELQKATQQWSMRGVSDPPSSAAENQEVLDSHERFEDAIQMAHNLQRAAENELSFHGGLPASSPRF